MHISLFWCRFRSDPVIQGTQTDSAATLKSRNSLITKIASTSWCVCASTLRTWALCYSVTEYCCPVWARSNYTSLINTQLHSSMHRISGCQHSTPVSWLPVLSNVAPPSLRGKAASDCGQQQTVSHIVTCFHWQSSMADYNYFTKLKITQSSGWSL